MVAIPFFFIVDVQNVNFKALACHMYPRVY